MYQLHHKIGIGGMGIVYAAHKHPNAERLPVAVKLLRTDLPGAMLDQVAGMFNQEAVTAWRLNHDHPNLVTVYDFGVMDTGVPYMIMEYVDGVGLDMLERSPQLDYSVVRRIARDVLAALAHLHANGFVHRDVTPRNILISRDGLVKLTDLGLVKEQQGSISGCFRGTPAYASPEALQGRGSTPSSDLYSLGSVLYELTTGMQPYGTGTPKQVMMAMYADEYKPLPDEVPKDLAHLVRALTEFDPDERIYRTAAEALDQVDGPIASNDELAALVARSPRPEPDPDVPELGWPFCERPPEPATKPPQRRAGWLTGLLALSLCVLGGFGLGHISAADSTTTSTTESTAPVAESNAAPDDTPSESMPTKPPVDIAPDEPNEPQPTLGTIKVTTHPRSSRFPYDMRASTAE